MKRTCCALGALFVIAVTPVFAVVHTTLEEFDIRYGSPVQVAPFADGTPATLNHYRWNSFHIGAAFPGSDVAAARCMSVSYEKEAVVTRTGPTEISPAEIEEILALNSGGSSWQRTRRGRAWMRRDKAAFAVEHKYTRDGVPGNMLAITDVARDPETAAKITASLPSE